ncbi:alpha/beta hydrolase [Bacteroidales bacterium AH-315-I05]|nr:alpha/beta hydrolase [Bacteroidales bacterium AH-315-I05]
MLYFIAFLFAIFLLISLAVYYLQEKLIFHPTKFSADFRYQFPVKFEEINFETEKGVTINALHFKADTSKGLALYFHGNAGALDSWGWVAEDFTRNNYDLLIMDYRGYGKSTGKINSEKNLHHDASFIYNEMLKEYAADKIVIYGRSIGTGIASKLAVNNTCKLLILETPYYNLRDLAKKHMPFLPVKWMLRYKLENNAHLQKVKCPVYILHGTYDEVVPYEQGKRLSQLAENTTFITIEGGTHNNLPEFPLYQQKLVEILNSEL